MSKQAGRYSESTNDFLPPNAPTIGAATDVGTNQAYNNGAATVTFTPSATGVVATSYTVTSSPGGYTATGTSSPLTVTGLQSGTSYTFSVIATNAFGNSSASAASNSITATTVPQAPTIGTASDVGTNVAWGNAQAVVTFTANATGGKPITAYTVTSSGSQTATGASSPLTVSGMSGGTNYSFTAVATNANGSSLASGSASVTPTTVPAQVTGVSATSGVNNDSASWSIPDNGGLGITNYYVTSTDGYNGNSATNSITIADPAGNSLSYTVYATNINGNGQTSAASNSVTTQAPFFPPFFPPSFFAPPGFFAPPSFFAPPGFFAPPTFFAPPSFFAPPGFFAPPSFFAPPGFFAPPSFFAPPGFFNPPHFFAPPGFCIDQDTNVLTTNGYKKAKDISVNDILLTRVFDTLPIADGPDVVSSWNVSELSNSLIVESKIKSITITPQSETYIVNNNQRFSVTEELLILRDNQYRLVCVSHITKNDKLVTYAKNGNVNLIDIFSIELINEDTVVYDYVRSPHGLIVADGLLAYNAYPIK
jgi:hypothetical protein